VDVDHVVLHTVAVVATPPPIILLSVDIAKVID
jgi:hypothetical protein